MNLLEARYLAIDLMTQHGIYPEWDFKFDGSRIRHGQARETVIRGKPVKQITASKYLAELADKKTFKDTILHEIAHALVGLSHMHDEVWHAKAIEIGSSGNQFVDTEMEHIAQLSRYHYVCDEGYHPVYWSNRVVKKQRYCIEHPEATIHVVDVTLAVA